MLSFALLVAVAPGITLNVTDGQLIEHPISVRARVTSERTIKRVEFFLDGELAATDRSTPYEFILDPVKQGGDRVRLRVLATDAADDQSEASVTLRLPGMPQPEQAGQDAQAELAKGNADRAIVLARKALDARPNDQDARLVLVRALLAKRELGPATSEAEPLRRGAGHVPLQEASSAFVRYGVRELFARDVRRVAAGQDALLTGIELAKAGRERLGEVVRATPPWLVWQGIYDSAELTRQFDADPASPALAHALIVERIETGDLRGAAMAARTHGALGQAGPYALALQAALNVLSGGPHDQALEGEAGLAFGLWRASRVGDSGALSAMLMRVPEARRQDWPFATYRAMLALPDGDGERAWAQALAAGTLRADPYLQLAHRAIAASLGARGDADEIVLQRAIADAALAAAEATGDRSFAVRAGYSTARLLEDEFGLAVDEARIATVEAPQVAAGWVALAGALNASGELQEARAALDEAAKLDRSLAGQMLPDAVTTWRWVAREGRLPVFPPPVE